MTHRFLASVSVEAIDVLAARLKLNGCGFGVLSIAPMDHERDGGYSVQLSDVGIGKVHIIIAIREVLPFGLPRNQGGCRERRHRQADAGRGGGGEKSSGSFHRGRSHPRSITDPARQDQSEPGTKMSPVLLLL